MAYHISSGEISTGTILENNEMHISKGGVQFVPPIAAVQYVYLDLDGELTSYRGEILTVENVEVQHSELSEERIKNILTELNKKYAAENIIFVTEIPPVEEYSTIYIGKTEAFEPYGSFAGLAETLDKNNENKTDKAFVMLNSANSNEEIINTISHETDHLFGTLNHGGEGLAAYAAHTIIGAGTTSTGLTINSGNSVTVSSGGVANSTTINHNATLKILSGGTANNTIISNGYMDVDFGGTANNTTINNGSARIATGAIANSVIFADSGSLSVSGALNDATVNPHNIIWFGNNATGTLIKENGGFVSLESGANVSFVENTFSGMIITGAVTAHSGTTAAKNTINSNGNLLVQGGVADSNTVNSGGWMHISSGGLANDTIINNGGYVQVYNDGVANSTTINHNATLKILSGGTANNTIISNGYMDVDFGGTANNTTINNGSANVVQSAVVNNTTVNSGGHMNISSGGVANKTTVNLLGRGYVSNGGIINETTINDNGYVHVYSGGTANSTLINWNGGLYISSGGSANNTVAYGNFMHGYNATLSNTTLNSGGYTNISSGTVAEKTTINSNGSMFVSYGGTATDIIVNSGGWFGMSGGHISNLTLNAGGQLGGFAFATDKHWDSITGYDIVIGTNATISNRYLCASSGANISDVAVYSNAVMDVDGGRASSLQINRGGAVLVLRGGVVDGITVNSSGTLTMCGVKYGGSATANNVCISSGGMISLTDSGSYLNNLTIKAGGRLCNISFDSDRNWSNISFNGVMNIADNVTYDCNSSIIVNNKGIVSGVRMTYNTQMDVKSGGTAVKTTIDGTTGGMRTPRVIVYSGGVTSETTVIGEAALQVEIGGRVENTTVSSGGFMHLSGTANSTTVNSSGEMFIYSGGVANDTTISKGAAFTVYGVASNTMVASGGSLIVEKSGVANGIRSYGDNGVLHINGVANDVVIQHYNYSISMGSGAIINRARLYTMTNITLSCGFFNSAMIGNYVGVSINGECVASSTNVNGTMKVLSGGTAYDTLVGTSGHFYVSSGGYADTIVLSGQGASATLEVGSGGVVDNLSIERYDKAANYGYIKSAVLNNRYGSLTIGNKGKIDEIIANEGTVCISSGGMLNLKKRI